MQKYGVMDASFQTAGEEEGIRKLVDEFYHQMETLKLSQYIRAMHADDLDIIKDKLAVFFNWLVWRTTKLFRKILANVNP